MICKHWRKFPTDPPGDHAALTRFLLGMGEAEIVKWASNGGRIPPDLLPVLRLLLAAPPAALGWTSPARSIAETTPTDAGASDNASAGGGTRLLSA